MFFSNPESRCALAPFKVNKAKIKHINLLSLFTDELVIFPDKSCFKDRQKIRLNHIRRRKYFEDLVLFGESYFRVLLFVTETFQVLKSAEPTC
mgnify:CR=1 FL=1